MKFLLTSGGVRNPSIRRALTGLLGRPIDAASALAIPTALYGHARVGPTNAWRFLAGSETECPMVELGWKSVGVLELTALPSIDRARWMGWIEAADVLLVAGGDASYLGHWLRVTGVAAVVEARRDLVWLGMSAGSMVTTPRIGAEFIAAEPLITPDDRTLGWVPFSLFPHLEHPALPSNTLKAAKRWAAQLGNPAFAIDDETALQVTDGAIVVISEGRWHHFP